MPRDVQGPVLTSGRFVASAGQLGFSPPPVPLRLRLVMGSPHWTLFVQPLSPASVGALVEWLHPWDPLRVEFGSRSVLRADFDPLPAAWSARFRALDLDMLFLAPNGDAVALVKGPRRAIQAFAGLISLPGAPLDISQLQATPPDARLLTKAQDEALRMAVDAGYYRIPRPLNLQQLAKRLGISCASLSERLRRAEGRVIARYVNEGGKSPWDERTLFDAHPSSEPQTPPGEDPLVFDAT